MSRICLKTNNLYLKKDHPFYEPFRLAEGMTSLLTLSYHILIFHRLTVLTDHTASFRFLFITNPMPARKISVIPKQ